VLSISKLSAGQGRYYLDHAHDRVDVIDSVGDGLEEYYVGGHEARGEWLGAAARGLGLTGPVDGESLRHVLAGEREDGQSLRTSRAPVSVAGFDLTLSAPKSVSVVFGLGEPAVRDAVRAAHDRAVREALGYVERTAAAVRRGAGGVHVEPANGLVAAAFRHRTSRSGDPQLHTHVLVANLGQGPDGRWSALDGRRLYAQARATSFVYQAVLRSELSRRLEVEWLAVRDGIAEIAGVPQPVMRAFSRRRVEIEAALAEHGSSTARAAEAAALATRRPKDTRTSVDELAVQWRTRAAELGFGEPQLARALGQRRHSRAVREPDFEHLFDGLATSTGLTRRKSTFNRGDVVQALCERLPPGQRLDAALLEGLADRFLASTRVVALLPGEEARESRVSFRRRDGRALPLAREERSYSTPELLALEQRLVHRATASRNADAGQATIFAVEQALAARPTLSAEQQAMVEHICLSGERVSVVVGKAGTGKTYALAAARDAWQASGHPVLGAAVARRAANQLRADAGIATTSVAALLADIENNRAALPRDVVLVLDEAGMVATRPLARLLDAVERAQGKLVLVGDHRQLPELEAGGTFRALVHRGLAVELTENRRQREAWERQALDQLRDGDPESAMHGYAAHDRVHIAQTPAATRQRLARDWHAARGEGDAVMIAQRRSDVADLNQRARALLRETGEVGGPQLTLAGGEFAAGDQVVIKRNDSRLGVTNGERGRVLTVNPATERIVIELGDVSVTLDRAFLSTTTDHGDPSLLHGYAITCHVAQGLSVDHALVLADDNLTRELAYTALSRGRHSNHIYLAREPDDARAEYAPTSRIGREPLKRLTAALKTSRATVLAIDTGRDQPGQRLARALHELASAREDRAELEHRRWRPGRSAKLAAARDREATAEERLERLTRKAAEVRHADRPFLDENEIARRAAAVHDRVIERRLDHDRSRGLER
jgi:conjugative relaxase-like TrwC/TraI family protein